MSVGPSQRNSNLFSHMGRVRQPADRKPVDISSTLLEYKQSLQPQPPQIDMRNVTLRQSRTNIIGNADDSDF